MNIVKVPIRVRYLASWRHLPTQDFNALLLDSFSAKSSDVEARIEKARGVGVPAFTCVVAAVADSKTLVPVPRVS